MKKSQKKTEAHKGAQLKDSNANPLLDPNQQAPAYTADGKSKLGFIIGPDDKESIQNHPNYTLDEEAERIVVLDEVIYELRGMDHDSKVAYMKEYFQRCNWQSRYETFMKTGRDEVAENSDGQNK